MPIHFQCTFLINQGHHIHTEYNFIPYCFHIKSEECNMLLLLECIISIIKMEEIIMLKLICINKGTLGYKQQ